MPIINIKLVEGRSLESRRKLAEEVTESTCRILNVPKDRVILFLEEMRHDEFCKNGIMKIDQVNKAK